MWPNYTQVARHQLHLMVLDDSERFGQRNTSIRVPTSEDCVEELQHLNATACKIAHGGRGREEGISGDHCCEAKVEQHCDDDDDGMDEMTKATQRGIKGDIRWVQGATVTCSLLHNGLDASTSQVEPWSSSAAKSLISNRCSRVACRAIRGNMAAAFEASMGLHSAEQTAPRCVTMSRMSPNRPPTQRNTSRNVSCSTADQPKSQSNRQLPAAFINPCHPKR